MSYNLLTGNALDVLKTIPDGTVQTCITSPPYYGLRCYGTEPYIWDAKEGCNHDWGSVLKYAKQDLRDPETKAAQGASVGSSKNSLNYAVGNSGQFCTLCNAWKGELGLEPTVQLYISHLTAIFAEVNRVLKDDGSCWINIGDSYAGTGSKGEHRDPKYKEGRNGQAYSITQKVEGVKRTSLIQIPSRLALSLADNLGWVLRNEIIWHKPNAMPHPAKNRFTVDFEKIYFFTKTTNYKFYQQFEEYANELNRWGGEKLKAEHESEWDSGTGQNTYRTRDLRPNPKGRNMRTVWSIPTKPSKNKHYASYPVKLVEVPILASTDAGDIILDPFNGTGTTGVVALSNDRQYIGVDLKEEYMQITKERLDAIQ